MKIIRTVNRFCNSGRNNKSIYVRVNIPHVIIQMLNWEDLAFVELEVKDDHIIIRKADVPDGAIEKK